MVPEQPSIRDAWIRTRAVELRRLSLLQSLLVFLGKKKNGTIKPKGTIYNSLNILKALLIKIRAQLHMAP